MPVKGSSFDWHGTVTSATVYTAVTEHVHGDVRHNVHAAADVHHVDMQLWTCITQPCRMLDGCCIGRSFESY